MFDQPAKFNNTPYNVAHPDKTIAGKPPISAPDDKVDKSLEMPILKNTKTGYHGEGTVGPGRVITWKGDAGRKFTVVGHDNKRGRQPEDVNEHYIATHTKATR